MTTDQWQSVKSIFDACLERSIGERAAYLTANCTDTAVRAEVVSLLNAYEESEEFLDDPSPLEMDSAAVLASRTIRDERLGPYRLLEEIGRGGMGTVYRAQRDDCEFQKTVAVKVVLRGMGTDVVLRRFRTERQILASLDHPYIARILDGGTTRDGLPYFVMEYVDGLPLTKYCDSRQLTLPERLKLFRKACEAVSYAHQNMVVHLDLKPGNILVTADGTPKLLDFGIAKLVNQQDAEDMHITVTMLRMATPAYASPEQIRGGLVGAASDVYSLGVVLYELLTGHPPYKLSRDLPDLAQIICEREPTKASSVVGYTEKILSDGRQYTVEPEEISAKRSTTVDALQRKLRGDLDNIVAMALRKDPQRRYSSVEQFSEDVRRHLEGLPVLARNDTFAYRASKFIGRHKLSLAVSSFVAILLCATTFTAIRKAQRLAERVDADQRLATRFLVDVHSSIAKLPGSTAAREVLLRQSLQYLNGLAGDAGDEPSMRRSLALAYEKVAELQGGAFAGGLGQATAALETYEKAQAIREELANKYPDDLQIRYELANTYLLASFITGRARSTEQRLEYDRKALAIAEDLVKKEPSSPTYLSMLAKSYTSLAYGLQLYDRWEEERSNLRKALSIYESLAAQEPSKRELQQRLAHNHYRLGVSFAQARQPADALPHLRRSLDIYTRLLAEEGKNLHLAANIASTHHFLGMALGGMQNWVQALAHFDEAVRIRTAALQQDGRDERMRSMLAGNYAERAAVQLNAGDRKGALSSIRQAIDLQHRVYSVDPNSVPGRFNMAAYYSRAAEIHVAMASGGASGHWHEAASYYKRADVLYTKLNAEGHLQSPQLRKQAAEVHSQAQRCERLVKSRRPAG
jgi:non-specific serine/threonine protein kinase/serine/threonine-protein kinase